ncbi:alkaline phosphatase family protein [Nocardioides marmoribigeumensis]|uniref:alkaline phosphatase family protein n=1 Tax=Nocardioides marmoribigeumensis TaxID=433649 RepID=UPI00286B6EA3|nr:alkaline phosphatase family protein [Nocardioides marmoribigeumensis]
MLVVLFDQMLPQYADQFDMPNYRRLREEGHSFDQAYLGYMASETVIAHNVLMSGLLPKHMGYTDEAYRDWGNVFGKGARGVRRGRRSGCSGHGHLLLAERGDRAAGG